MSPQDQPKKKVSIYLATAPFVMGEENYKAGDEVALPGWKRDLAYDAARGEAVFAGEELKGLTFQKEGPVIDKTTQERNLYRVTLPVKEQ